MKKLLVSDITNTIYLGNAKDLGNGKFEMTGKKEDFTDEAIRAVFEWFMKQFKESKAPHAFQVKYEGIPYILQMVRSVADDKTEN